MPLYDFVCSHCETVFEEIAHFTQETTPCRNCNQPAERRLGATFSFCNDPTKRAEVLKKRSEDHTRREQRRGNLPTLKDFKRGIR